MFIQHGHPINPNEVPKAARKTKFQKNGQKYICYAWKKFDLKLGFAGINLIVTDYRNIVDTIICPPHRATYQAPEII